MSFVGDLEHLPIVDVIQLLHATRKSGTLCLKSKRGESQLVFRDGCIVSANHANNSYRIGQILVRMQVLSQEELDATLAEQERAGAGRVPLVATLIEGGRIRKEDAFKGLETLIEMTIVEVLTWTEGTFELDVDSSTVSDEYRYIPEKLKLDLHLNTQNVLMDALRIYDEKKRDGTLIEESFDTPSAPPPLPVPTESDDETVISIDDLGLDVMDDLEKVIPGFFTPVKIFDPNQIHRDKLSRQLAGLPPQDQERLFSLLLPSADGAGTSGDAGAAQNSALILFSTDDFIRHTIMTACKNDGLFVFATDEEVNLDHIISQSAGKDLCPSLVIDAAVFAGDPSPEGGLSGFTHRCLERYPFISVYLLVPANEVTGTLHAITAGVRAVLPKPDQTLRPATFVDDTIAFLAAIRTCIKAPAPVSNRPQLERFRLAMEELSDYKELTEITRVVERFVCTMLARAGTFVARKSELVAEQGFSTRDGSLASTGIAIPMDEPSPFQTTISEGRPFFGPTSDPLLTRCLYPAIPQPMTNSVLLVPVKCLGRVLAVVYGDFGSSSAAPVDLDLVEALARHAGVVYENALYRKKFEKMLQNQ
jgi:hypothetical protein